MRNIPLIAILLCLLSCASANVIQGDVYYLGVAINQEGAAGGWEQVGGEGQWKQTMAGAILQGSMYTVDTNGGLYLTDLKSGGWKQIGKPEFADTRFMVSAGPDLYTIEGNGTLYRVNSADGTWQPVGEGGAWKRTIAAASLEGRLYLVEAGGGLFNTNVDNGKWARIGKPEFGNTRFLFASGNSLYTINTEGTLHQVSPSDGAIEQIGQPCAWKTAIGGTIVNEQIYTVEADGKLFCTDPRTGQRQTVGKADFANTRFMFPSAEKLYTIEESGNLYRVEAKTGKAIDSFDWCTDEIERIWRTQGTGLSHGMHSRKIIGVKATRGEIMDGLKWLKAETKPHDLVVFYIGAHGSTDPKKGWNIDTADADVLWGSEVKRALGELRCNALVMIETCESGGFAEAHDEDPPVPPNVTALCACKPNETTDNPLDIAIAEALYGRGDFNHDGTIDLDELVKYVELRYKEMWPAAGEGSNTPVIARGSKVKGSLSLTKASNSLAAVALKDGFWSAVVEGEEGNRIHVHLLGWSSEPGTPYFLTNTAERQQVCMDSDGPPLLVERDGHWLPARRVKVEGGKITAHLLGRQSADVTVGPGQVRYPFVGGPR